MEGAEWTGGKKYCFLLMRYRDKGKLTVRETQIELEGCCSSCVQGGSVVS